MDNHLIHELTFIIHRIERKIDIQAQILVKSLLKRYKTLELYTKKAIELLKKRLA